MEPGPGAVLLLILCFAATFLLARVLGRGWRERRRERQRELEHQERLKNESRQVRRARERRGKP